MDAAGIATTGIATTGIVAGVRGMATEMTVLKPTPAELVRFTKGRQAGGHSACYAETLHAIRDLHMRGACLEDIAREARPACPQSCEAVIDYYAAHVEGGRG